MLYKQVGDIFLQVHHLFVNYNLYILRELRKLVIVFFTVKNTHNLISLSLFHRGKIVNQQKKIKDIPIKEKLSHIIKSY